MNTARRDIVLVHGAGGGGWQWRDWRPVFEGQGLTCHSPDLQPVEDGLEATKFSDYVHQITDLVARIEPPPVIVGASIGGIIALKVAEEGHCAALVLVNSVPPAATDGWNPPKRDFPPVISWSTRATLDETRRSMLDASDETVAWAHARWRDESGRAMRAVFHGVPATTPRLPTLIVSGGQDTTVKPAVSQSLGKRLHADVMTFAGVSHVGALLGRRAPFLAGSTLAWLRHGGIIV